MHISNYYMGLPLIFVISFVILQAFVVLLSVLTQQEWSKEGVQVKH
jgi:hypothetical protein